MAFELRRQAPPWKCCQSREKDDGRALMFFCARGSWRPSTIGYDGMARFQAKPSGNRMASAFLRVLPQSPLLASLIYGWTPQNCHRKNEVSVRDGRYGFAPPQRS